MSLSNSLEEAMSTSAATSATTHISTIFGAAGSSAATAHPHVELNGFRLDPRVLNLLVANEKIIRDQCNEILRLKMQNSQLLITQASRQEDLPAAAAQPLLAHGIDPDATIVLPWKIQPIVIIVEILPHIAVTVVMDRNTSSETPGS
ncbi:hypothetical protein HYPSUDRAFT_209318 [Hypholoma sublateritium FD-334 SS-4]|uniref:Uncharacterized protein n=1 Tax=Hypholoma sublateritium (strain FD-334 SS-4) TaxID=945553 RepID=A0A0D2N3A1_HYPSF|nr:hypothetical protein HYPSUDRAFT_209318 [Hypholoma sublateritium FD-334 SS-4]